MFKNFKNEFIAFISKGNALQLAIGVVTGAAFTAIINSIVNDIINPIIGFILAGIDFSDLKIVLKAAVGEAPEVAIRYGSLINATINFFIVSFLIFLVIKALNKLEKPKAEAPAAPAGPTEKELLADILAVLKNK